MEINGNYLHLRLRRTNREIPYHANISDKLYPLQNLDMLNQIVNVIVKDDYRVLPDDVPEYRKISDPDTFPVECRVIRFDMEDPWVAVYISLDYQYVVVDSSASPSEYPLIYAIQYDKDDSDIIGSFGALQCGYTYNDNMLKTFSFPGTVISSTISEPVNDVIIGEYGNEEFTVYLGSEVWCKIEGNRITDPAISAKFKTISIRKMVMGGRVPYGFNQNPVS